MIKFGGYVKHMFTVALILTGGWSLEICRVSNHTTSLASASPPDARPVLSFQARVSYQRALEHVYWKHRIWVDSKSAPKPELGAVMSIAQIEAKVKDNLELSQALGRRNHSATVQQIQAEIDRMANHTRRPEMLRELWAALENDPYLIAECLARPLIEQRLAAQELQSESSSGAPPRITSR